MLNDEAASYYIHGVKKVWYLNRSIPLTSISGKLLSYMSGRLRTLVVRGFEGLQLLCCDCCSGTFCATL